MNDAPDVCFVLPSDRLDVAMTVKASPPRGTGVIPNRVRASPQSHHTRCGTLFE